MEVAPAQVDEESLRMVAEMTGHRASVRGSGGRAAAPWLAVRGLVYFRLVRCRLLRATLHGWGVVGVDVVARFRSGYALDTAWVHGVAQLLRGLEEGDALGGHIRSEEQTSELQLL